MKVIELNRPAISTKLNVKELHIKPYVSHMHYMDKSRIIQVASLEKPVYRLCKDYEIDGIIFALNLLTDDKDAKRLEKFLDDTVKNLTREQAVEYINRSVSFSYLDTQYKPVKRKATK